MKISSLIQMFSIIFMIVVLSYAEGPRYSHKEGKAQLEFDNVYKDIRTIRVNTNVYESKTIAQFQAYIPRRTGETYYCSNCTNQTICISTGTTGAGQFSGSSARTATCN